MVDYGNWKLNEIFNDTFPNLGWAKRMDDKPKFAGNYEGPLYAPHPDLTGPYPDEMFEEAERREKSNRVLQRYNDFYNAECAGLTHGTPITPEHQQALALDCMVAAIRCENLNREFDQVPVSDIEDLIEALYQQGRDYLDRVQEFKDSADGVA
jgi:hypothetical protein